MNEVFILGKIEEIKFEFMYESKYISICVAKVRVKNKSVIEIYAHNEMADMMIQELREGKMVWVNGKLRYSGMVEVCFYSSSK